MFDPQAVRRLANTSSPVPTYSRNRTLGSDEPTKRKAGVEKTIQLYPARGPHGTMNTVPRFRVPAAGTAVVAALLALGPTSLCVAQPSLQWSFQAQAEVVSSPCLADLDGDGLPEVLFGSYDSNLYVVRGFDGSTVPPWPRSTGAGMKIYGSPAVADLDGDGQQEIVVGCEDTGGSPYGWVWVWRRDGDVYPGWPQPTGTVVVSPAIGDLDGDGSLELVVSSEQVYAFRADGTLMPGQWPVDTGSSVRSSPALGDVDGDGLPEVAIGTDQACVVHLLNWDGSEVEGWPYSTEWRQLCYIPGAPALGDLDGDALPEVVFGSDTHGIYAVDGTGQDLPGWPAWAGYWVASSPALADLDNDHHLEVAIGSADGFLYLLRHDGSAMPGWPQFTGSEVLSNPALGDADGDGDIDIVVGTFGFASSRILAFDASGMLLWELPVGGNLVSSPALGDVDGDGHLELLIGCRELNTLYCYDLGPGTYDPDRLPWPMFHRDSVHTGLYPDLGPVVEVIAPNGGELWSGIQAITWNAWGDGLSVDLAWSSNAGQMWNGIAWGHPNTGTYTWNTEEVPDGWTYLVRVEAYGEGLSGWDTSDATFTIKNHAAPNIDLLYPTGGELLTGAEEIQWIANDPDGDTLSIDLLCRPRPGALWQVIGTDLPNSGSYPWETAGWPDGEEYRLRARAFDGIYWSEDTSATFAVHNPDPPQVELLYPNGGESLTGDVTIVYEAADPDGDSLLVHAECTIDGWEWMPIATDQPDTGAIPWGTDSFPNSATFLLRVGASDTSWTVWDTCDAPFAVYNNHAPTVCFLEPSSGDTVAGETTIRWRGDDPEADTLAYWLRARWETGAWDTLVAGSADTTFPWSTEGGPDGPWTLGVVAADPGSLWSAEAVLDVRVDNPWLPVVELLHPLGGEQLAGVDTVRWAASDPDGQLLTADVHLLRGDTTWVLGTDVTTDRVAWDTQDYRDGGGYVVRVGVRDQDGLEAADSSGSFSLDNPHPPCVDLLWPQGGEVLTGEVTVSWVTSDPDGDTLTMKAMVKDSPLEPWTLLAEGLADDGTHVWETRTWADGTAYELRIHASDGLFEALDSTAAPFSIFNPTGPMVQVVYPNGGEVLQGTATVQWIATDQQDDSLSIDILVSDDHGQSWQELSSDAPNDGSHQWDTTPFPNGAGYVLMVVASGASGVGTDRSDEPFSVANPHPPTVTVLRPLGDETVTGRYPVKWDAHDPDGDSLVIDIAVSTDGGVAWEPVITETDNWGVYVWDTTGLEWSPRCELRVTAKDGVFEVSAISESFALTNACAELSRLVVYPNPCFLSGPRRGPVVFQNLTAVATIDILDVAGRRCRTLRERDGDGRTEWNLSTDTGLPCAGGLFFYRVRSPGGHRAHGRILLAR
jgi:hypothetical protein